MERNYYFIDMHTHLLPNVDDGAKSVEVTQRMLQMAYEEGIHEIIATPHFSMGHHCKQSHLSKAYLLTKEEAKKISSDLKIYLSNEIYYSNGIIDELKSGSANTIAESNYVLIEFSERASFRTINEGIRSLVLSGYRPILAHVERYLNLYEVDRIEELINAGCYIQVNSKSFLGGFFDKRSRYCKKLAKLGYVHFVGSDCHNTQERAPTMKDTYRKLSTIVDSERLDEIFYHNPRKVLANEII